MPVPVLVVIAGGAIAGAQSGAVFGGAMGAIRGGIIDEHDEGRLRGALKGGARGAAYGALTGMAFGAAGATLGLVHSAYLVHNFQGVSAAAHPNGYVYTIVEKGSPELVKIGRTNDLARRLLELQRETGKVLEFTSITPTWDAVALEKAMHTAFDGLRRSGEWFALHPGQVLSIPANAGAASLQGLGNAVAAAREALPFLFHAKPNRGDEIEDSTNDNELVIIPVV